MTATIKCIPLERLIPHPDSPNRMSKAQFEKLVRNIERTGRYEPLVVRPCPGRRGFFQIINGRHRCEALRILGHQNAEAVVWRVDDEQTDLLLATLNGLHGRDTLEKKLAVLQRLSGAATARQLAKLLPQTRGQIERLVQSRAPACTPPRQAGAFAVPMVFLVDPAQEQAIEEALARALADAPGGPTRAARRATALAQLARRFLEPGDRTAGAQGLATAADPAVTADP